MSDYDNDIIPLVKQGFCCAQIVMQLALEIQGRENPGLIRAMAGLCQGYSAPDGACGALTGAACLLAHHAAKGQATEESDPRLALMLTELSEWFQAYAGGRFGGISCRTIVGEGPADQQVCVGLIAACYGQALLILTENGFDPASPLHD